MTYKEQIAHAVIAMTGQSRGIEFFFGSSRAMGRQWVIESATGQKTPKSKCGYHALRNFLLNAFEIDKTKYTIAEADQMLNAAIRQEWKR